MQSKINEPVRAGRVLEETQHSRSRHVVSAILGVLALVAALATALAVPTAATAASAAVKVPAGCGQPAVSSTGHTLSLHCRSGHGGRYKIIANACDSHHCVGIGSSTVKYGSTAKVTSGGYLSSASLRVYWYPAKGGSACAYSKPGGTVAWCDMQQSILDWVKKRPVYDDSHFPSNWYGDKSYRTDCSGLVSMAWHLTPSWDPDTDALATSTYTKAVARKNLRAGDILDDVKSSDHNDHHVVIFAGWNADHHQGTTDGTFKIWTFGYGTFANDSIHHQLHDSFSKGEIAEKARGDYTPRRYVHGAP